MTPGEIEIRAIVSLTHQGDAPTAPHAVALAALAALRKEGT